MNYEEMSDFEINKCVAEAVGMELSSDHSGACVGVVRRSIGSKPNYGHVNYCNSPSDAWPIMEKNGIATITENGVIIGATNNSQEFYENFGSVVHSCINVKTFRAAMIVFLMMQEKSQ